MEGLSRVPRRLIAFAWLCCALVHAACGSDAPGSNTMAQREASADAGAVAGDPPVAGAACNNSLDCGPDQVCDDATARCVQCVRDADCGPGERCVARVCRGSCERDAECMHEGLLCDRQRGVCARCVRPEDCAPDQHCSAGECVENLCEPGRTRCTSGGLRLCNTDGSGYALVTACSGRTTCVEDGDGARCEPWLCTPLQSACSDGVFVRCRGDGLAQDPEEDCGASELACTPDGCRERVCIPETVFCDGAATRYCSPSGWPAPSPTPCFSGRCVVGSDGQGHCLGTRCRPGEPLCDGERATVCDELGEGPSGGGTDCSAQNARCDAGACLPIICTPAELGCRENRVVRCSDDGTRWLDDRYCGDSATCTDGVCL